MPGFFARQMKPLVLQESALDLFHGAAHRRLADPEAARHMELAAILAPVAQHQQQLVRHAQPRRATATTARGPLPPQPSTRRLRAARPSNDKTVPLRILALREIASDKVKQIYARGLMYRSKLLIALTSLVCIGVSASIPQALAQEQKEVFFFPSGGLKMYHVADGARMIWENPEATEKEALFSQVQNTEGVRKITFDLDVAKELPYADANRLRQSLR